MKKDTSIRQFWLLFCDGGFQFIKLIAIFCRIDGFILRKELIVNFLRMKSRFATWKSRVENLLSSSTFSMHKIQISSSMTSLFKKGSLSKSKSHVDRFIRSVSVTIAIEPKFYSVDIPFWSNDYVALSWEY